MTDLNHITVIGRITKTVGEEPHSFEYLQSGTCKAKVSLAVNRSVKKGDKWEDETSFFDVVIFGKTAENLKPYLTKGTQIGVEGYLKQDRWQDGTGNNRSKISIIADSVQLLGSRNQQGQNQKTTKSTNRNNSIAEAQESYAMEQSEFPDDVPF